MNDGTSSPSSAVTSGNNAGDHVIPGTTVILSTLPEVTVKVEASACWTRPT